MDWSDREHVGGENGGAKSGQWWENRCTVANVLWEKGCGGLQRKSQCHSGNVIWQRLRVWLGWGSMWSFFNFVSLKVKFINIIKLVIYLLREGNLCTLFHTGGRYKPTKGTKAETNTPGIRWDLGKNSWKLLLKTLFFNEYNFVCFRFLNATNKYFIALINILFFKKRMENVIFPFVLAINVNRTCLSFKILYFMDIIRPRLDSIIYSLLELLCSFFM